jgi:hypothetical protein
VKSYLWWNNGNVRYSPSEDRNQETAYRAAKEKGPLSTMPEIPGLILWMKGHAGVYIGNGEFIECAGAPTGMRKGIINSGRVVSGSRFTHWFKDTNIQYPAASGGVTLIVNGNEREVEGFIQSGISYLRVDGKLIAMRTLGESLGFKVGWDSNRKAVLWND